MELRIVNSARRAVLAASAVLALGLAGCVSDELVLDDTYVPYSPSERYPIEYAKGPVTMQVDTGGGTLMPSQVNAVAGFARQSMAGGLSPVTIRRPAGGGKSARVADEIAGVMMQMGVPANMIRRATYPAGASAPVQIGYVKAYAHTKPCGEWNENVADTGRNERFANHGCAVQSNIAAMIANPQDLVSPETSGPGPSGNDIGAVRRVTDGTPSQRSIFSLF